MSCAYRPIQIWKLHDIRIKESKMADADMSELLGDVRSTTTEANDPGAQICEGLFTERPEKALTRELSIHFSTFPDLAWASLPATISRCDVASCVPDTNRGLLPYPGSRPAYRAASVRSHSKSQVRSLWSP